MYRDRARVLTVTGYVLTFVLRRLGALVGVLVVVSFGVFTLLALAPGETERILLGDKRASEATLAAIRERYNLDDPFFVQYAHWLADAARFDFGTSIRTGEPVLTAIMTRLDLSVWVGLYGFIVAVAVGLPLGILAAVRGSGTTDRAIVGMSVVGVSAPAFATGIFLLYVFAVALGWFPAFGEGTGFLDRLEHLTLPAVTLAVSVTALIVKVTRASMIGVLEQDYVAFARARGIATFRVFGMYALRNALIPIVTASVLLLSGMLAGSVLVEVTFGLNGAGALFVESVTTKDIPVVQGIAVMGAVFIVLATLITDLLYLAIDPRIRFGKAAT